MPVASDDSAETMTVELRFYAPFREAVGRKSVTTELPAGATLEEALANVTEEYPELDGEVLDEDGKIGKGVRALRNGRNQAEADTHLEDGDEVSFMTPIHGG